LLNRRSSTNALMPYLAVLLVNNTLRPCALAAQGA
jgi:hypothetical protein